MKSATKVISAIAFAAACCALYQVQGAKKAAQSVRNAITGEVQATVGYIFDGDTFAAKVLLKDGVEISVRVRIMQIDAPEIHGECAEETAAAERAKSRLGELLPVGSRAVLTGVKDDKYLGRIDAYVMNDAGQDVGNAMIQEKLARKYSGGKRMGWCD
jgi:endonuclease YncB( thermonuclease family)